MKSRAFAKERMGEAGNVAQQWQRCNRLETVVSDQWKVEETRI
jgi:hypothetical protein